MAPNASASGRRCKKYPNGMHLQEPRARTRASTQRGNAPKAPAAPATFQLLAAAAPLSGGSFGAAWDPDGLSHLRSPFKRGSHVSSGAARKRPVRKYRRRKDGDVPSQPAARKSAACVAQVPHDMQDHLLSTRLVDVQLQFRDFAADCGGNSSNKSSGNSPRYCVALAQMRCLRELSLSAFRPSHLHPADLTLALKQLAALESLSIDCSIHTSYEYVIESYREVGREDAEASVKLVEGVARLTQISSLRLDYCVYFGELRTGVSGDFVSKLSQLTQLTALSICGCGEEGSPAAESLSVAVKALKSLIHLQAVIHTSSPRACAHCDKYPGRVAQQLCGLPQLSALQGFSLEALYSPKSPCFADCQGKEFPLCSWAGNAALLARLTELNLSHNAFGCLPTGLEQLMTVLRKTPALEVLDLSSCVLHDPGMLQFVSVVPKLLSLTRLRLKDNEATHRGLFPVLEALITVKQI